MDREKRSAGDKLILFVAEGFGAGRFPVAPGTVGTLVGFVWIYLLLIPENVWIYVAGIVAGFFAAVWFGSKGEIISGRKDPGSIVIDEIAALPLAFLGSVIATSEGSWTPPFIYYFETKHAVALFVAFVGFRFFDIRKPWFIGRSQQLPGGWGLVLDDYLAALHVAPLNYLVSKFF
jgi:phosphatidylglycerophosphatase A